MNLKTYIPKLLALSLYTLTILTVLFAGAFWWASVAFNKAGPSAETRYVVIPLGVGLRGIADILRSEGVVENPYIFIFGTRVVGAQAELKAGEYEFLPRLSPRAIMEQIKAGKIFERKITIPEGLTNFEIKTLLLAREDLSKTVQWKLPRSEGVYLPETYHYQKGERVSVVMDRMREAMTKMLDTLWFARAPDVPLKTKEEVLVLASIVEKETGKPDERARIAGVFYNRLKIGMPLQSDPTVIYGITKGVPEQGGQGPLGRRLLSKDLQTPSPYNTYLNKGLPPSPICNVGRAALEAVLHPEQHDYLYFVADGTGGHVFARTLAEHNRNVAQWRRVRD